MQNLTAQTDAGRRGRLRLCAIISVVALLEAIVYGFSFPYFSIYLEQAGVGPLLIGLNTTAGLLAVILFAPLYPRWLTRFGYRRFSIGAFAVVSAGFAALPISSDLTWWFLLRFVIGAALAGLWVSTEAWLNHVVPDDLRGRTNAVFQALYSLGFFVGPTLTYLTGFEGVLPALAMMASGAVAIAMIAFCVRSDEPTDAIENEPIHWKVISGAKGILALAFLTGVCETAAYALLPIYGLAKGLAVALAVSLLVAWTIGEVFVAFPIGWLADRVDRQRLLLACTIFAVLSVAMLLRISAIPLLAWAMAFIAGGLVVSLYNLSLVQLGERFKGAKLPVVTAAFAVSYSAGSAVGATLGGFSMDTMGPNGFPVFVAAVLCAAAVVQIWWLLQRKGHR